MAIARDWLLWQEAGIMLGVAQGCELPTVDVDHRALRNCADGIRRALLDRNTMSAAIARAADLDPDENARIAWSEIIAMMRPTCGVPHPDDDVPMSIAHIPCGPIERLLWRSYTALRGNPFFEHAASLWRHGGNCNHGWRPVARGGLPLLSETFDNIKRMMRQGGLALVDHHGDVVRYYQAPRLRTRW